jgi:hypothetical protein
MEHWFGRFRLEELQSHDIEAGISSDQFNSRGVVSYAVYEGGAKEMALAKMA